MHKKKPTHPWRAWNPGNFKTPKESPALPNYQYLLLQKEKRK